jgi:PAS domain S-box-containing protein
LFNDATDMIHLVDPDGRIIDANQIELEKMGFSREEYIGKSLKDLIHPDYRELSMAAAKKVFAGEPIVGHETIMVSRDGTPISVEVYSTPSVVAGKVAYARSIIRDISARKREEAELAEYREELEELVNLRSRALKESEENLAKAQEIAHVGSWDWDLVSNAVTWSDELSRILGFEPNEVKPSFDLWFEMIHPSDVEILETVVAKVRQGAIEASAEYRMVTKSKSIRFVFVKGYNQFDEENNPVKMSGIVQDITGRKQAELSLTNACYEAERANKTKSKFLSSMSHELRTPMNAILGYGQLLESNPQEPLTETQKKCVNHILKGGAHLLGLISDLLDLAKIEANKIELIIEDIQATEIIDECVSLMSPLAEERNIDFTIPDTNEVASLIRADRMRFNQVLLNLLSNAIKYNREGGNVIILFQETADDMLRISVTDTGEGISKDKRSEIFQPFSRLGAEHTEIEGTGIGLVVCNDLMELMEGRIGFESRVGKGSTFWIELPLVRKKATVAEATKGATTGTMKRMPEIRGTLLYVEDNPADLRLMELIVSRIEGLSIISAPSGELGMELVMAQKPDVIILDINLPGMNGIEVLKKLRSNKKTRNIPTLALNAVATKRDIEKGLDAGFKRYLTKPIQVSEVVDAIKNALETALNSKFLEHNT